MDFSAHKKVMLIKIIIPINLIFFKDKCKIRLITTNLVGKSPINRSEKIKIYLNLSCNINYLKVCSDKIKKINVYLFRVSCNI